MSNFQNSFVSFGRIQVSDVFNSKLFKYAISGRSKKIDQLLLSCKDKNYDIDACNTRGQTPLFAACMLGHYKVVSLLLQLGANPNRRSDDGSTPTHAAAFSCVNCVLQIVCEFGGDLRLHDDRDLLPRDWAVEAGTKRNKKILELMDSWQNEILAHIEGNKSGDNMKKYNHNSSVTKVLKRSATMQGTEHAMTSTNQENNTLQAKQRFTSVATPMFNSAFGNFSCVNIMSHKCDTNVQRIGFSSLIPIISADQLTANTDDNIRYQSLPHFVLTNGYWGNQPITKKKARESKRRILRHMASTRDLMMNELQFFGILHHANILTLLAACVGKCKSDKNNETSAAELLSPNSLIFEHISYGSLYGILHENNQLLPSNNQTVTSMLRYLQQIACALEFIHARGFIHCCLTSHAIHIVNLHSAKLSDFYYSLHADDTSGISTSISSAFNRWLAPELLANKPPSFKCDVYSLAVVLSEASTGVLPWKSYDVESIRHQVVTKGKKFPIPEGTPVELIPLLKQTLEISRRKRNLDLQDIITVIKRLISKYSSNTYIQDNFSGTGRGYETEHARMNDMNITGLSSLPPTDHHDIMNCGVDVVDAVPLYHGHRRNEVSSNGFPKSSTMAEGRRFGNTSNVKIRKRFSLPPNHTMETADTVQLFNYSKDVMETSRGEARCPPAESLCGGDNVGDESAGLIHPVLMDSDSFDSSLAESYGYHRRSSMEDDHGRSPPQYQNKSPTPYQNAAKSPPDLTTSRPPSSQHHSRPPSINRGARTSPDLQSKPLPDHVDTSLHHDRNTTYRCEDVIEATNASPLYGGITEEEDYDLPPESSRAEETFVKEVEEKTSTSQQHETNKLPEIKSSLSRCDGFRNNKKKPNSNYLKNKRKSSRRNQNPVKVSSMRVKRKNIRRVYRSVSDPITTKQQQTYDQQLEAVPEQITESISETDENEEETNKSENKAHDESSLIEETVERVHNSLRELSKMLTPTSDVDDCSTHVQPSQTSANIQVVDHPQPPPNDVMCGGIDSCYDVIQQRPSDATFNLPKEDSLSDFAFEVIDACGMSNYFRSTGRNNVMTSSKRQKRRPQEGDRDRLKAVYSCISQEEEQQPGTSKQQDRNIETCTTDDDVEIVTSHQEQSRQRRFSLGSSDLEDLYSKFADRQSTSGGGGFQIDGGSDSDDPRCESSQDESLAPHLGDSGDDDMRSYCGGKSPSFMFVDDFDVTQSLPPQFDDAMPRVDEIDDVTRTLTSTKLRRSSSCDAIEAQSPPQLQDFINTTFQLSTNQQLNNDSNKVQQPRSLHNPRVLLFRSKSDCAFTSLNNKKKSKKVQVGNSSLCSPRDDEDTQVMTSRSATSVGASANKEKMFSYLSIKKGNRTGNAVIPASHMPPMRQYQQQGGDDVMTMTSPPCNRRHKHLDNTSPHLLNVTPSKWSFKMKRDVFEGGMLEKTESNGEDEKNEVENRVEGAAVMTTPINPPHLVSLIRQEKGVKTSTPLDRDRIQLLRPPTTPAPSSSASCAAAAAAVARGQYLDESYFPSGASPEQDEQQISDIQKCSGFEGGGNLENTKDSSPGGAIEQEIGEDPPQVMADNDGNHSNSDDDSNVCGVVSSGNDVEQVVENHNNSEGDGIHSNKSFSGISYDDTTEDKVNRSKLDSTSIWVESGSSVEAESSGKEEPNNQNEIEQDEEEDDYEDESESSEDC